MHPSIYVPAEDSYLMSETLKSVVPKLLKINSKMKVLEVGIGSGVQLKTLNEFGVNKENIIGSDINPKAVEDCKKFGFNCIQSNLFDNINDKFDIIIFNPPYLPKDKREPEDSQVVTTAGEKGNELIIKFLQQAKEHLNKHGKIFLITSSLSAKINFKQLAYNAKEINSKKLFFEKLFVWELGFS